MQLHTTPHSLIPYIKEPAGTLFPSLLRLRAVTHLRLGASLNLRTRASHSNNADCPPERSSSSSGCPTVLESRDSGKVLPAGSALIVQHKKHVLAPSFLSEALR